MGRTGQFFKDLEGVFGAGNVTSGYRTQEEQDDLVRRGKTRATRSSHTYENGYDVRISAAQTEQEVRDRLAEKGFRALKIIKETGKGKNQGTAPHWHTEIERMDGKGTPRMASPTQNNATSPGVGVADVTRLLDNVGSALAPEVKASGNVRQNSGAIFGSDQKVSERTGAVERELANQGQVLDVLGQVQEAAQAKQKVAKVVQVEETRAINNQILEGQQKLAKQVTPVFQVREKIADQLDHIATMNPLERSIRGIFDLNYNREHLVGQLEATNATLKVRKDDFSYMTELGRVGMEELTRRYGIDTAMTDLELEQNKEDLTLAGLRVQQTQGLLNTSMESIRNEANIIAAQDVAKNNMLGQLDSPTVADLHAQAVANNGVVTFNGVPFSANELRERAVKNEERATQLEMHQIAIASGRVDIAEKLARTVTRSLTRDQALEASANGGVITLPDGSKLQADQLELGQVIAGHDSAAASAATRIADFLPPTAATKIVQDTVTQINGLWQRSRSIIGAGENENNTARAQNNIASYSRELLTAIKEKKPPEVIRALTKKVVDEGEAYRQQLDQSIIAHVGGDKKAATYVKAHIYNSELDPGTAAQGMAHFAVTGSLPRNADASPAVKQIFQMLQTRAAALRDQKGMTPAKMEALLTQEAQKLASSIVGGARFEELSDRLPTMAASVKHDFGKIKQRDWERLNQEADYAGATAVGRALNTTPDNVLLMQRSGKPLDQTPPNIAMYEKFRGMSSTFNGHRQQVLVESLDDMPNVRPGTRNSEVMQEFLASPEMMKRIQQDGQLRGHVSMGDYLLNPLAPGATEGVARKYSQDLSAAMASRDAARRQTAREQQRAYGHSTSARVLTILSSIPGVGKEGRDALQPFIREQLGNPAVNASREGATEMMAGVAGAGLGAGILGHANMMAREQAVLAALSRAKFEDPVQEAYRKAAVKGWKDVSTQSDGFLANLKEAIGLSWD